MSKKNQEYSELREAEFGNQEMVDMKNLMTSANFLILKMKREDF